MKYPAYPKFKDSGVQWLGEVPEHWEVSRLDFLATIKARLGWKALTASEYVDDGYVFLSTPNIKGEKEIDFSNVNYITEERYIESPEIMLQTNDVLLAKDGSTLGITNVVRSLPRPATVNGSIAVIRKKPRANIDSSFLFRWITGAFLQSKIESLKDGQGVPHLFQSDIRKFPVLLPSHSEQTAIADFLDRETGRIDTLVAKKRRLLELLEEKRTALISRTVTRGLPTDVAREFGLEPHTRSKDSGVEWLGEVPEEWEVLPLRRLVEYVKTGSTPKGAEEYHFRDGGLNWYSPGDFSNNIYLCTSNRTLSEEGKVGIRIFPPLTIMLVGIGATIGKVGISTIESSCNQQINAIVTRNKLNPVFATYYFKIMRDFIVKCGKYTTLPIINQDETKNIVFPVPPNPEQIAIATYLDREIAKINQLKKKVEEAIARLQEYRTALITATVTGKIDVREPGNE